MMMIRRMTQALKEEEEEERESSSTGQTMSRNNDKAEQQWEYASHCFSRLTARLNNASKTRASINSLNAPHISMRRERIIMEFI